ncbi:EamA domain-containing protein [Entamoeba marina]
MEVIPEFHPPHRKFMQKGVLSCIILLYLLSGTLSITVSKTCFSIEAEDFDNDLKFFRKPLFFNFLMFAAMASCTIPYFLLKVVFPDKNAKPTNFSFKHLMTLAFPSLLGFSGTYLQNVGLVYIHGSVFQMLRGSVIIFIALLQVFFKKEKIETISNYWLGSSSFAIPSNKQPGGNTHYIHKVLGIGAIIIAQLLNAYSGIVEETLSQDVEIPPSLVVAVEGWFGVIFSVGTMIFVQIAPIPGNNILKENTAETFLMLLRSPTLYALVNVYSLVVLFFNLTGMTITSQVSALTRNVIDPLRMAISWATLIQIIGFIVLTIGFFIYAGIIPLPTLNPSKVKIDDSAIPILQDDETNDVELPYGSSFDDD